MQSPEPDDGILVARARRGDKSAFGLLVRRHARAALVVARSIAGNPVDAEDICQDAWVRALEKLEECRQPGRFVFWLLQIVRNQARNHLQYRRVRAADPLDEVPEGRERPAKEDPSLDLDRARQRTRLERAMNRLTEGQREVLVRHDLLGWRHREIAEDLGLSEVLSRQRLFQARTRMRQFLGETSEGDPT